MITFLYFVSFILLGFLALVALYWSLVRPVLRDHLARKYYNLRKRVELAGIDQKAGSTSKAYLELLSDLRSSENFIYASFNLMRGPTEVEIADEKSLFEHAEPWIKEARDEMVMIIFGGTLMNSPAVWPLMMGVSLALFFSDKAKKMLSNQQEKAAYLVMQGDRQGILETV